MNANDANVIHLPKKKIGQTRNPYDLTRTPGGSSGGEAALISSGASLIGLSSDIAGSARLPAMFTGKQMIYK